MEIGNPFEVIVYHLLIGGMIGLYHQDGVPMVSALVCMVIHWTRPTISHDIKLLGSHDFTKLIFVLSLNLERI